jgi:hypothetical protein
LDLFLHHGDFQNIAFTIIFGIFLAFILKSFGIKFFDAFFSVIGFDAHLLEDELVYDVASPFLWPFSTNKQGLELFPDVISSGGYYIERFFRIANTEILIIGLLFLVLAIIIRTYFEGPKWMRWYMPENLYLKISGFFSLEDARRREY